MPVGATPEQLYGQTRSERLGNMMDPRDRRKFLWYLMWIAVTGLVVAHMFFRTWIEGGYRYVLSLGQLPFMPQGAEAFRVVGALILGFYLVLLFLFVNDYRKRYQGYLLVVASLTVTVGIMVFAGGLPTVTPLVLTVPSFLLGVLFGLAVESLQLEMLGLKGELLEVDPDNSSLGRPISEGGDPVTFPVASRSLVTLVAVSVVSGFLSHLVVSPLDTATVAYASLYLIAGGIFLLYLKKFIELNPVASDGNGVGDGPGRGDAQGGAGSGGSGSKESMNFEVLGPKQSGKTYFALGMILRIMANEKYEPEEIGGKMLGLVDEYESRVQNHDKDGSELDWSIAKTVRDETTELNFEFLYKRAFPTKEIRMDLLDHAGELLDDIAEELSENHAVTDGGIPEDEDGGDSEDEDGGDSEDEPALDDDSGAESTTSSGGGDADSESPTGVRRGPSGRDPEDDDGDTMDAGKPTVDDDSSTTDDGTVSTEDIVGDSNIPTGEDTSDEDARDPGARDQRNQQNGDDEQSGGTDTTRDLGQAEPASADDGEVTDNDRNEGSGPDQGKLVKNVVSRVNEADKLVFLLDSERFHGTVPSDVDADRPDMQVSDFNRIARNVDVDEVILVASKADFFLDAWQRESDGDRQPAESDSAFESFREHVAEQLTERDTRINALASTTNAPTIHPVYFKTEKRSGEIKPKPDENGKIQPVGFDRVLDELIKDV